MDNIKKSSADIIQKYQMKKTINRMTDAAAGIKQGTLWRVILWLIMWYIKSQSKRKKLTITKKRFTWVSLNWIGIIDDITITSALPTEKMSTVQHYPNIWQIKEEASKSPIIKWDIVIYKCVVARKIRLTRRFSLFCL